MSTNSVNNVKLAGWQYVIGTLEWGKTDLDGIGYKESSNPYGMSSESETIWTDYYTGKTSFMNDFEAYLEDKGVEAGSANEAQHLKDFVIGTFNLEGNKRATDALDRAIFAAGYIDADYDTLSHGELTTTEIIDGQNGFSKLKDLFLEFDHTGVPQLEQVVVGKEPEHNENFNVNLDSEAYPQCMHAIRSGKGTQAWQDARDTVAEAIAKKFNIPIYDKNNNYTELFQNTLLSVLDHSDNQSNLSAYYNSAKVEPLDKSATTNDILDLFIGVNTDGAIDNDDFSFVFTIPEHDIMGYNVVFPEEYEHYELPYRKAFDGDIDPDVHKIADDYINAIENRNLFQRLQIFEPTLDTKNLDGKQLAQLIDVLYTYTQNRSFPAVNFKNNDKKAIQDIIQKLQDAEANNDNVNSYAATWRLEKLDGYQLTPGHEHSEYNLSGDYSKYYFGM